MNVWPPTVIVAARAPALFGAALTVTVPLPVPELPLVTVSHVGSLVVAFHAHQLPVVTVIVPESPPTAMAWLDGEIVEEQAAAAWLPVKT